MIKLTIGSSEIPINPGISFPLVMKSPLFVTSEGKIPGSYIFNTSIPATQALRTEFGHAHRIMRNGRATAELNYILEDGTFRFAGKCSVTEANERKYEIAFRVNNGDLAGILSTKSLKDLNLGGDTLIAEVCSISHDPGFFRSVYPDPPYDERLMSFSIIDCDFGGNFSTFASTFTSPMVGTVKIKLAFILRNVWAINMKARFYKDGSIDHEIAISEGEISIETEITGCIIGTELCVKIYAEYDSAHYYDQIKYTVTRPIINYYTTNIFTEVVALDQNTASFTVFPILNERFLDKFPDDKFELDNLSIKTLYTQYFPVINYWKNGEFPIWLAGYEELELFSAANLFTPFVYMNTLLNQIAIEAGYSIVNSPFSDDFEGAILFNAYAENTYTSENAMLTPVKTTFNLIDHVPDIGQADFIRQICKLTGYFPIVDNNQLTITFVKINDIHIESATNESEVFPGTILELPLVTVEPEYKGITFEIESDGKDEYLSSMIKEISEKLIYKGEVASINLLPSSGNEVNDMYKVTSTKSFYVWQYNSETYTLTWIFFSRDWPLKYEEGEAPFFKISTGLSPILTTFIQDEVIGAPTDRYWTIPVTKQAGILEGFPDSLSGDYGFQILIYRGMVFDSNDELYPLGTSRTADYANDLFPDLNARDLFNAQYKNFMEWIAYSTKPVKCRAILTAAQLKKLDFAKIYRYEGYSFLIKEVRVNLLYDRLSLAEMDIYIC